MNGPLEGPRNPKTTQRPRGAQETASGPAMATNNISKADAAKEHNSLQLAQRNAPSDSHMTSVTHWNMHVLSLGAVTGACAGRGCGARKLDPGTWGPEPRAQHPGAGARARLPGPWAWGPGPAARRLRPRAAVQGAGPPAQGPRCRTWVPAGLGPGPRLLGPGPGPPWPQNWPPGPGPRSLGPRLPGPCYQTPGSEPWSLGPGHARDLPRASPGTM